MDINEINRLPITDQDQIAMLVEAGEEAAAELIQELLDLFKEEALPQLEAIRSAVASRSVEAAGRPAHALAGSSANLGGLRLSKLARALELTANAGETDQFVALAAQVEALFEKTVEAFREAIAGLPAA